MSEGMHPGRRRHINMYVSEAVDWGANDLQMSRARRLHSHDDYT